MMLFTRHEDGTELGFVTSISAPAAASFLSHEVLREEEGKCEAPGTVGLLYLQPF